MRITQVIGPSFFGYAKAIADFDNAEYYNELFSNNFIIKILIRLRLGWLFTYWNSRYYNRLFEVIYNHDKVNILFLDIEFVPISFLLSLRSKGITYRIYFWDSVKNKPIFKKYLKYDKSVCSTFDYIDSIAFRIPLVNLFAEKTYFNMNFDHRAGITFVGTMHSIRPKVIRRLIDRKLEVNFKLSHFYYYNSFLAAIRAAVDKDFRYFYLNDLIRFNPIDKGEINRRFNMSEWVLDIAHPGQTGLTSRTFEGLTSGAFLLTNNMYYKECLSGKVLEKIRYYDLSDFESLNLQDEQPARIINSEELGISFFMDKIHELYN